MAVDASRNILLIDPEGGTNGGGALFSINSSSGRGSRLSNFGDSLEGDKGVDPIGVAIGPPLPPPTQQVDLTIANMEITQAIQNFANDVPLVQDKPTYVRVYPKVDIADRRARAQLRGFLNGEQLPGSPLIPEYPFVSAHPSGANRAALNDSFNFLVPRAWRSGTVTFRAEINPRRGP